MRPERHSLNYRLGTAGYTEVIIQDTDGVSINTSSVEDFIHNPYITTRRTAEGHIILPLQNSAITIANETEVYDIEDIEGVRNITYVRRLIDLNTSEGVVALNPREGWQAQGFAVQKPPRKS